MSYIQSQASTQLTEVVAALDGELDAAYQGLNNGSGTYANKKTFSDGTIEFECYTQLFSSGSQDGIVVILAADGVTVKSTVTQNNSTNQITIS